MEHQDRKAQFLDAYDAHADAIYRFCRFKVPTDEVAEDLTQDTFTRYWQALQKGAAIEQERAYLYTLARNLTTDWYRKKKAASLDVLQESGYDPEDTEEVGAERSAEGRELLEHLAALDAPAREILELRFVEGLLPKEIAELMGENTNTISVRITRALAKLRARYEHPL